MKAFAEHGDPTASKRCKWCGKKLPRRYRHVEPPRVWTWEPAQAFDRAGKLYTPDPDKGTACTTLDRVRIGEPDYGYMGNGTFCTATCGWLFGCRMVALGNLLRESGVELRTDVKEPGLVVNADPEQIQQVLLNLVKNADEALAGRPGARVDLRASRDAHGAVQIHVVDNGPGIEESLLDNIFVPFFTTKRNGTGIGLSISRQLMVLNKGSISVKTHPGAGTELVLKLR